MNKKINKIKKIINNYKGGINNPLLLFLKDGKLYGKCPKNEVIRFERKNRKVLSRKNI